MNASEVSRNSSTFAASRNSSTSSASRNSSASSAFPIKTLYVINHLRDVERMLTWIPPVMMALKLTISHMKMTLYSTVSFSIFLQACHELDDVQPLSSSRFREVVQHQGLASPEYRHLFRFSLSALSWSLWLGLYSAKTIRITNRNESKTEMFLF